MKRIPLSMTTKTLAITEQMIEEHVGNLFYLATHQLPSDIFNRMNDIYQKEVGPNAKEAIRQIIENAVLARQKERPMCQDTGFPVVFIEYGVDCGFHGDFTQAVNKGVAKGYTEHFLRKSMVKDPVYNRVNTGDNTPAILHTELVPGNTLKIMVEPKGVGSENMSQLRMLKPSQGLEGIKEFVLEAIFKAGANPCPPILLGIGIGGTFEKSALLAKRSLFDPVLSPEELQVKADSGDQYAGLALELITLINQTGIGTQGMGGIQMCLGVNIRTYPTHIGAMPVALNIQCHAARHAEAILHPDGHVDYLSHSIDKDAKTIAPPAVPLGKVVSLTTPLSSDDFKALRAGDRVEITGTLYTARDAAHKRMLEDLEKTGRLPVDLTNEILYYVGPVPAIAGEVIGPAGPTTASRMDKYAPTLLEKGLKGMIGKGYRSPEVKAAIQTHGAVYFVAIGGLAVKIAQTIKKAEVIAYADLGAEAIHRLEVEKFPAIVAIDSLGNNLHEEGREAFRQIDLPEGL
jgi:fumarate hydratase, class I